MYVLMFPLFWVLLGGVELALTCNGEESTVVVCYFGWTTGICWLGPYPFWSSELGGRAVGKVVPSLLLIS